MQQQTTAFQCIKCKGQQCETGEFRAAGGFWSKIFNVQGRTFQTKTCVQCRFVEVYDGGKSGKGTNILDFLTN